MTASERELAEIRDRLSNDPEARQRFVAGLGDALMDAASGSAPAPASSGPIGELMAAANAAEGSAREDLLAKAVAAGALLWAPPLLARIVLAGQGSGNPVLVLTS